MNVFGIGYLPEGWLKGTELKVLRPTIEKPNGCVLMSRNTLILAQQHGLDVRKHPVVLYFHLDYLPQVEKWLEWWVK